MSDEPKEKANPPAPASQSPIPLLIFNGSYLSLVYGDTNYIYPATSGNQKIIKSIPEGDYWIMPSDLWTCGWLRPFTSGFWTSPFETYDTLQCRLTLHSFLIPGSYFIYGNLLECAKNSINLQLFMPDFIAQLKGIVGRSFPYVIPLMVVYPPSASKRKSLLPLRGKHNLKLEKLLHLSKKLSVPEDLLIQIDEYSEKFNINSHLRLAYFLGQCKVESNFKAQEEGLSVRKITFVENKNGKKLAKQLKRRFDQFFPGQTFNLDDYVENPAPYASLLYAGMINNGDPASGDGYTFRGRGIIQLTGKGNYEAFSKFIGDPEIMKNPNLIITKYSFAAAMYFFNNRPFSVLNPEWDKEKDKEKKKKIKKWLPHKNLWELCDKGSSHDDVINVTRVVNSGLMHKEQREEYFREYLKILNEKDDNGSSTAGSK